MTKDDRVVLVDKDDNVVGTKLRSEFDYAKDIYRVSCLWVTNRKGEVLMAQRHQTKKREPNKWGVAVAGTVEDGETYESNMYKEAEEEIGLTGIVLTLAPKQFVSHVETYFVQWFSCVVDKPASEFKIQPDEVEQVKWISMAELKEDYIRNPDNYVESMSDVAKQWLKP